MGEPQDRRTFLKRSAVAASALAAGCRTDAGDGRAGTEAGDPPLPPDTLRAVAEVVLPSEIGPDGRERVVESFEAWLAAYVATAEQVHGYGSQEIHYGPPDPAPAWRAQLAALEEAARARHGGPLAELDLDGRAALVARALPADARALGGRPEAIGASHVALGLAGFFFGSPEAVDLCYGRRIGGLSCRDLESSGETPPLDARREPVAHGPTRGGASGPSSPLEPEASDREAASRLRAATPPIARPRPVSASVERGLEPGS